MKINKITKKRVKVTLRLSDVITLSHVMAVYRAKEQEAAETDPKFCNMDAKFAVVHDIMRLGGINTKNLVFLLKDASRFMDADVAAGNGLMALTSKEKEVLCAYLKDMDISMFSVAYENSDFRAVMDKIMGNWQPPEGGNFVGYLKALRDEKAGKVK